MATSIKRTLNNLYHNKTMAKYFNCFKQLNSSTPIPNQALPIDFNKYGEESILYFTHNATKKLQFINDIAYKQTEARTQNKKTDREIEFYCIGYVGDTGDYVIEDITIPALDFFRDRKTHKINYEKLFLYPIPSDVHTITTTEMSEFVRCFNMSKNNYRKKNLALYGTTRSTDKYDNARVCPTIKDLSSSIVAGDTLFPNPIATGVLIITPKEHIPTNKKNDELVNGSLECLITNYRQTEKGLAYPESLSNINQCKITPEPDYLINAKISKSDQNTSNIPNTIRFANIKNKTM
jgi:hypothetical protein